MFQVEPIVQAALLAFFSILIILLLVFSALLGSAKRRRETDTAEEEPDTTPETKEDTALLVPSEEYDSKEEDSRAEQKKREEAVYWKKIEEEREREKQAELREQASIRPIYEKYPLITRFEILYWRGVSKPWWWNNYAKDLVEYANEYFPWNKVDYYSTYNANSKSEDYSYGPFHKRIMDLRTRKLSKHALVVINYSEEYIMIDSYYALQEMMDRIDAEWYRQYGFKKTYRHSPTTYRVR